MTAQTPEFPFPAQRPSQVANEQTIRAAVENYLGRPIEEDNLARMLAAKNSVYHVESVLRNSREYLLRGHLRHPWFRSVFDRTNLVLAPARVLFCPIAKVANTSVKFWFVALTDPDAPRRADVHRHIDSGASGLQTRQFSFTALEPVLSGEDWARVAILRDPVDRVISAYWDKFVTTRTKPGVMFHVADIYKLIYNATEVTPEMLARGISFRQFCHYLARTSLDKTDPHWLPQHRYLENYSWDRLFDIDRISEFEDFIRARLPDDLQYLQLGMENAVPRAGTATRAKPGWLADRLPESFEGMQKPPNEAFLPDDLRRFVENYYAMDRLLIDEARRQSAAAAS